MLKPAPYNLKMADQTTTKPVGLICDLNIYVHTIPIYYYVYCVQNNVIDVNYSMLLRRPWLRDAKITHDWGNNTMTNQRNRMAEP
jgi:hypothetical protein